MASAILALLIGGRGQAKADIVYNDGNIYGLGGGYSIYDSYAVSDSFTPSAAGNTTLTGAQNVGIAVDSSGTITSLKWSIGTTVDGSNISSGTAAPSLTVLTIDGIHIYSASFALNGIVSYGNTYYFTLQNTTVSDGGGAYWDANSGPSAAVQTFLGAGPSIIPAESFQLVGSAAVPEPSSFILFGLAAIPACALGDRPAARMWRKAL